jgi:hypothetical protein
MNQALQALRDYGPTSLAPLPTLLWSAGLVVLAILCVAGIAVAVVAWRRWPRASLAGAVLLTLGLAASLGLHAWMLNKVGPERVRTLAAMGLRPGDPWPRGAGHAPLGPIGARPRQKGQLEPGGGFSPSAGSFGVSFWVVGPDGRRLTSGDELPLAETRQAYLRDAVPGVQVVTPAYDATWRAPRLGVSTLSLATRAGPSHVEVVLRGVGPAGGPLNSIARAGPNALTLNRRWRVSADRPLDLAFLGRESGHWTGSAGRTPSEAHSRSGWAAARLRVPAGGTMRLEIADLQAPRAGPLVPSALPTALGLPGVDPRFDASLNAQVATLEQAIIGDEIAPGNPIDYPLPWLRDGAYALVALARAGQTERLRTLAAPFARRDFFGGFGAEADAPGLALWALGEVSVALNDPAFDRGVWPDVAHKAALIERMIDARRPIREPYLGPIVLRHRGRSDLDLVAEPARDGLIVGRMDWHRPAFYVNAVSYAGLRSASQLATRLGHDAEAARWGVAAETLRRSWRGAFAAAAPSDGQLTNDRTAIAGLWPAEIADPMAYRALLDRRWLAGHDPASGAFRAAPLWTYFDVAEAHQWLRLDRPDRVWSVLTWFWANQPAPGLYTLWEGDSGEDNYGLWGAIRGGARPHGVTPHSWSAAEMLLLQLAMLAEVEGPPDQRVLAIGSGVPAGWLKRPFSVTGVGTAAGPVAWSWDGRTVTVRTAADLPVRLGAGFPPGTKLRVVREAPPPR